MTTPIDPRQAEETSAINDTAIARIDNSILDNIWLKLRHCKEYYSANISEIALGLHLSRPVITEFLGNGRERGRNEPKFSRGRILNLFAELTRSDKLEPKSGKKLTEFQERRIKLKEAGADELLIAAGLTPENMKIVAVSPQLEPQLTFISFLYEDRPLDSNIYSQIVGAQIDWVRLQQFESNSKKLREDSDYLNNISVKDRTELLKYVKGILGNPQLENSLQSQLDRNIWLDEKIKYAVRKNYDSAVGLTRRNNLLPTESTGLFKSVLNNELNKHERFDLDLMIVGVERTSLSIPWVAEANSNELLNKIIKTEKECENKLRANSTNYDDFHDKPTKLLRSKDRIDGKEIDNNLCLLSPVTRTVVNCKYYKENDETINFECVSTGTQVGTATSAIVQNMGFKHCISKMQMDMNWLGEDIKSLVNTIVTITDFSGGIVSGEWVSVDLMQSFLQALKVAGNKWFYQNCLDDGLKTSDYKLIIHKTANLKADFYKHRYTSDQIDIENKASDIRKFQNVGDAAIENIALIRGLLPEKVQKTFLNTSYRINILCKLYMLHDSNTKIDHEKCSRLIEEIQNILTNKTDEKEGNIIVDDSFVISAKISLCAEKIAYNLSFGIPYQSKNYQNLDENNIEIDVKKDLLKLSNPVTYFKHLDSKIDKHIENFNNKDLNKDPGYDMYHSLGSYHSIVGRVLFYKGNKDDTVEAFDRFLKAACYFQRIGLTIKVQRSLALAGRVKVRLGDKKMVSQCIDLSESILEKSKTKFSIIEQKDFASSIKSRVELLQAEESFITVVEKDPIILCLNALKGALKLGLSRHAMDILHTIFILSKRVGSRKIKEDLNLVFSELFSYEDELAQNPKGITASLRITIKEYRNLFHSSGNNQTMIKIGDELYNNINKLIKSQDSGQSVCWADITEELEKFLIETWNDWYKSASKDKDGEHPFSARIKDKDFFKLYD